MTSPYNNLLLELKATIQQARYRAIRQVNRHLIELYWEIGKRIVESQTEHSWGKSVVEDLARDLQLAFPESTGFSNANLWEMRKFYLVYKDHSILQTLSRELSWSNNRLLLRDKYPLEAKEFYLKKCLVSNWSYRVLAQQIKAQAYERSLLEPKQHNFAATLPEALAEQTEEMLKSSYNLDFLGLKEDYKERDLEDRMIKHLRAFLLELGYGFTFVGRQHRLSLGKKEYYVDLVFYHRVLRCLVAVELKAKEFKPEYVGKLNFYLEIMDDTMRLADENPSIRILLVTEKEDLEVEYALRAASRPMGVAEYHLTDALPEDLSGLLPSPAQLRQQIQSIKAQFNRKGKN